MEQWSRFIRDGKYCFHPQWFEQQQEMAQLWDEALKPCSTWEPKYSIEQIGARVKKTAFVADRVKLVDLVASAVEAFYANDIGVGHAVLLAKLPAESQPFAVS